MNKIQITILKTAVFSELQHYCNDKVEKCPCFNEGQVFETTYEKPVGFCDWAWRDIHPYIACFMIRPVIFEIKKIEEN